MATKNFFEVPEWDDDLPGKNNKNKNKKKNKLKNQAEDNEPGKYVRINKNAAINLINEQPLKMKKRKIGQGVAVDVGEENEQSVLIKKRKTANQTNKDNEGNNLCKNTKKELKKLKVKGDRQQQTAPSSDIRRNDRLVVAAAAAGNNKVEQQQKNKSSNRKVNGNKSKVEEDDEGEANEESDKMNGNSLSFRNKLIGNLKGSRFRFLNEQLYSSDGSGAVEIFKNDNDAFKAYHDGYRQQVQQWPLNPLDRIIKTIKKLPKTLVVADFGCGEGRLAKSIPQKTYSLDLVAHRPDIIAGDMAKTPLQTKSIDVAVYCLSLMGINLKDFLLEANRVLKIGGQLKIAEVESRFSDTKQFVENVKSCGFQMVNQDLSNNLFYFINFKKVKDVEKSANKIPSFSLKPCLYKKR